MIPKLLQLLALCMFCTSVASAQSEIQFSEISFSTPDNKWDVKDRAFPLEKEKTIDKVFVLTSDGKVKLTVSMQVKRLKSKISQHKAQGVKLLLKYHCQMNGESTKNKTERVFWPDNDGSFKEKIEFSFNKNSLKPMVGTLQFSAKLNLN